MTHYQTLGVPKDASQSDIKKAYRKLSSQCHPDREGGDPKRMAEVNAAYEVLGDPARRKRYDETGESRPEQQGPTLEQQAYAALVDVFAQVLEMTGHDPVREVRESFQDAIRVAEKSTKEKQRDIEKLEKRRNVVTVTSGENIFTMLIDSKIQAHRSAIARAGEQSKIAKEALKMLEAYVYHPEKPEAETRHDLDMSAIKELFRNVDNASYSAFANRHGYGRY